MKLASFSAAVLVTALAGAAIAEDISTKKLQIKDHATDPAKRQIQVQSKDVGVLYTEADDPGANGMAIHVYSASDNYCLQIPAGALWLDNGKGWKYVNKETKNQAQISDGKLQVKIRSGVTFDLADDAPQDAVNVQVQFGPLGSKYCMRCSGAGVIRDDIAKFQGKDCVAAVCDAEPTSCIPVATTTTTTSTTSTSTTTTTLPGIVVGSLVKSPGRFNYTLALGLPAAESACNTNFPGSHACKYAELVASQGAPMTGLLDTLGNPVTDLWAIDPAQGVARQCGDTLAVDAPRWRYNTAHLGVGGDAVTLTNGTGMLGSLVVGGGANRNCNVQKWVACCQ